MSVGCDCCIGGEEIPDTYGLFAMAGMVGRGGVGSSSHPQSKDTPFPNAMKPQVIRGKSQPHLQSPEDCLAGSVQSHHLFLSSAIQIPCITIKLLPVHSTLAHALGA